MSTDILELSDAELQTMFENEKVCEYYLYQDDPYRVIWRCSRPAEWLVICKNCLDISFLCNMCHASSVNDLDGGHECDTCGSRSAEYHDGFRTVGKV